MAKVDKGPTGGLPDVSTRSGLQLEQKGGQSSRLEDINVIPSATISKPNSFEEISNVANHREDIVELGPSVFVCKHIVTEVGVEKVKQIFKKNGYDIDKPMKEETEAERKKRKKKDKERLKAWADCPNSVNPAKGVYIDPYCPNMGQMAGIRQTGPSMSQPTSSALSLTPGSIGVSKNQMAFHLSPLGASTGSPMGFVAQEGVKLKLGQSGDGTQCITITYDPPPSIRVPPPCATERETQFLESDIAGDKKGKKEKDDSKGKGKDAKKPAKK